MSNFDEKTVDRIKRLEREVERLQVKEKPVVITDHGNLTGLGDNDHPQYLLTTGKAADSDKLDGNDSTYFATAGHNHTGVYLPIAGKAADSDKLDGIDSTGFATAGHDHNADYLGITAKASDSDKLDNIDSTGFVQTSGNQTVAGIKTFSSIPVLPATNPTTANQAVRKGYADGAYLGISAKAADSDKLANTTPSSYALTILDDANAAAVKTTLGLKIKPHSAIADDDVYSFTPDINQGFMLYRKLGGATNALISYDAITGTAYCTKIAGSADVEVRTGALTGTTGTDGKLTISAHTDGKIYINNRLGATIYGGYLTL